MKDIPILNFFFSVKKEVILEREVMIFIKPALFDSDGKASVFETMQGKFKGKK